MFGNFGPWELILILAIALIVVGPGKLPQVGGALGKAIGEFRKASKPGPEIQESPIIKTVLPNEENAI